MKRISVSVLLPFMFIFQSYSQSDKKNVDFIIVINDDIAIGSIVSMQFETISGGKKEIIKTYYYPGNLSMKKNCDKLLSDSTKMINLRFLHYEYVGQKQNSYTYEIDLKKEWLNDYFNILRIYDLDKKKYKEKYNPFGVC